MTLIATVAVLFVLFGSLKPSAKSNAIKSQYRFPVGLLQNLEPGDVRSELAGDVPVFVVVPDSRIKEDIKLASQMAKYREIETYDEDLGAYILWGIAAKDRGPNCAVLPTEGEGSNQQLNDYLPGGFYDPCSGDRFDYAGRVLVDANGRRVQNLRKPEYELVASDQYQITNLNFLFRGVRD